MYHLSRFARATPDKVAVRFLESGEAFSFSRLEREANRAANALLRLGLARDDCIVLCIENSPDLLFLALGAQRIGLYYVLASTRLSAADLEYIVKDSGASVAIVSSACTSAETASSLDLGGARRVGIGFPDTAMERWETHFLAAPDGLPPTPAPGREMLYSSGTTGRPKGVRKPPFEGAFDAVDNRNAAVARSFALDASSVYLSTSPLYHSAPNRFLSAAIHAGATSIVMAKFDAERSLAAIAHFGCTHSLWVPTMFHRLLRLETEVRSRYSTASMVHAVHGAAPCPVHVKQAMIDWWGRSCMSTTRAPKASAPRPSARANGSSTRARSGARPTASCTSWTTQAVGCRRAKPGTSISNAMRTSSTGTTPPRPARRRVRKAGAPSATSVISTVKAIST
jgi:long-chain acyl-CoA synthetase